MPKAVSSTEIARRQAVGRRVVQALEAKEWSQSELARLLGLHPGNLSRMLQGERVLAGHLPKIATLCGVSAAWLRDGGRGGPTGQRQHRNPVPGRRPDPDRFVRRMTDEEQATLLPRAKEAWLLSAVLSERVLSTTIRAAQERTSANPAKGDRVALVVMRPGRR